MGFRLGLPPLVLLLGVASITRCQDPILPPTNVQVQFTGPRSFTVAWEPPAQPVLGYVLAYSGGNVNVDAGATHAQVVSEHDLDHETFSMGLYAQTNGGYSTTDSFTILRSGDPALPPSPSGIRNLFLPDTLHLQWKTPAEGRYDFYRLVFSKNGQDELTVDLPPAATSYTILDVRGSFYTHLYTIRNGIRSEEGHWQERTRATLSPPTDIYIQQTSADAFTIAWTPPEDPVDGYILMYSPNEIIPETKVMLNSSVTNLHVVCQAPISDQFRIGLVSIKNHLHSESEEIRLLLPGHELLPPTPVVSSRLTSPTTARLKLRTRRGRSDYDYYRVTVNGTSGPVSATLPGGKTEYDVEGIAPGEEVTVRIVTVRNAIKSDPVVIKVPDTSIQKPNSPTSLRRHDLDNSSIVLDWDPPDPPFDHYYLVVRRDDPRAASGQSEWSVLLNGSARGYVLPDLKPEGSKEHYEFTLYSVLRDEAFSVGVQATSIPWAPVRSSVSFGAITQHAVQVTWEAAQGSTGYRVSLVSDDGATASTVELTAGDQQQQELPTEHVFLGLDGGTGFKVMVDAVVDGETVSIGYAQGETAFWTDSIEVISYPPSTLEITWPDEPGAFGYIVSLVSADGADVRVIPIEVAQITLYNVETEVAYDIGIRATLDGAETDMGGITNTIAKDTMPPVITICPADVTEVIPLAAGEVNVYWLQPEAVDDSGLAPLSRSSHEPGESFKTGEEIVSYVFSDPTGNEAVCNFSVVVEEVDSEPPVITGCPMNITKSVYSHLLHDGLAVEWTEPDVLDNSGQIASTSVTHRPGSKFKPGLTLVEYRYADPSGNEATCGFSVTVHLLEDVIPPNVTMCPSDIHKTIRLGASGRLINWDLPRVVDDTGPVRLVSASHNPPSKFRVGPTVVAYVFEDLAGNRATCNFTVTVEAIDDEPPVILRCPSDINKTAPEQPTPGVAVRWSRPKARDNSKQRVTWTSTHSSGSLFPGGATNVTVTFSDNSNNTASCHFTVTILEGICDCYVDAINLALMRNCVLPTSCDADRLLANMTDIAVTSHNIESFSGALTGITLGHGSISARGIESYATLLEHISKVGSTSPSVAANTISSVNRILNVPRQEFRQAQSDGMASTRILKSLDFHLLFAHRGSENFVHTEPNLAAWTVSVPRNATVTYTVEADGDSVSASVELEGEDGEEEEIILAYRDATAAISLPTHVYWYDSARGIASTTYPAIFTFFNDTKLFQAAEPTDMNSAVIAASVAGVMQEIPLYNGSVLITLRPWQEHPGRDNECVFWNKSLDDGNGAWSTAGCHLADTLYSGHVVCSCNHLTHFALRLTPKVFMIDLIVFAGCVLCIGMMTAATIISLCIWAKVPQRTVINLCITLMFLNGLFLGGIDQVKLGQGMGCTIIAALLHYFLLVALAWCAVESLNLFWQVVLERDEFLNSRIVRVTVGCWGVPVLFVAYSRVIIYLATDSWTENSKFCFMSPGIALYAGVVTPLAVLLVFHLYIIITMISKHLCSRFGCSDRNITHAVRRCKLALPVSLLVTAEAAVGYQMLIRADSVLLRALFSVLAFALGGLLLAGVYCLGKKDLMDKQCRGCCRISLGRTTAYQVQKSMVGKKLCQNNGAQPKTKPSQSSFRVTRFTRVGTFRAPIWKGEEV